MDILLLSAHMPRHPTFYKFICSSFTLLSQMPLPRPSFDSLFIVQHPLVSRSCRTPPFSGRANLHNRVRIYDVYCVVLAIFQSFQERDHNFSYVDFQHLPFFDFVPSHVWAHTHTYLYSNRHTPTLAHTLVMCPYLAWFTRTEDLLDLHGRRKMYFLSLIITNIVFESITLLIFCSSNHLS